jgi:hypothetical protein
MASGSRGGRIFRWSLGLPILAVVGAWAASVLVVMVVGIWGAVVTGYWQPLAIAVVAAGLESVFALVAGRRIKLASDPFHSWWTVIAFALAVPLFLCNLAAILLTAGRIFPK